jgi:hypothetical protein
LAGAFTQLLERHEELELLIRRLIRDREVFLIQKGERFYRKRVAKVLIPVLAVNTAACGMAWANHAFSWSRSEKRVPTYSAVLALFPHYLYDCTGSAVLLNPCANGKPVRSSVVFWAPIPALPSNRAVTVKFFIPRFM